MTTTVLDVRGLTKRYGALTVTNDVDLAVAQGSRHALIGPNGAGKTTLFNLVSGAVTASAGTVTLCGRDITGLPEHQRARLGIGRTFQHSSLFGSGTCRDNVLMSLRRARGKGMAWRLPSSLRKDLEEEAGELLQQVDLGSRADHGVDQLSHGERRQLEVAMALAVEPRLLLFDEPTAGMSQAESENFTRLVAGLPGDLAVLIIEHDLDLVFSLADQVTVLATGAVLMTGSPDQVRSSAEVMEVYLGGEMEEVFHP